MVLSDFGAEVIKVSRPASNSSLDPILDRGKRSVLLDLRDHEAHAAAERLLVSADVVLEGFRPGVMERLRLGPESLMEERPGLIYGRVTGFGQGGPLSARAGHDINYIGLTGALAAIGRSGQPPVPPLNLLADFGGGGMLLTLGVLAALWRRAQTGRGEVIDAAMVDGVALMMAMPLAMFASGSWNLERGSNVLDSGAPFYETYPTADGKFLAVGAVEPVFYARLVETLGLSNEVALEDQRRPETWPRTKALFETAFQRHDRATWLARFERIDACVTPVLDMSEISGDSHHVARGTFITVGDTLHPAPAPRLRHGGARPPSAPETVGASTAAVLRELGHEAASIERLMSRQTATEFLRRRSRPD
jgi:alpha-methylacyl-CoA racemase